MSVGEFFKKIGRGVKFVAVKVAAGFSALFGKEQAEAFGKAALVLLQSALGKIVLAVVEEIENEYPGEDGITVKFPAAMKRIAQRAAESGLDAKDAIVGMLIGIAVAVLKGHIEALEPE